MKGAHEARVVAAHARIATSTQLAYRANFWAYLVNTLVTLGVSVASIALVYRHTDEIGGWSASDLLVVVGVFFALGAVVNGVVHSSMTKLVADIRTGDFDYRLLRPVDAQLVSIAQSPDPWRAFDLVIGFALVAAGVSRGGLEAAAGGIPGALAAAVGMFACAIVIVASFWALLASVAFWTIQGEGILWALDDMYDHLRWPIGIFPGGLRLALSTIFPAGLAVTVPAEALTGRLDAASAGSAVALSIVLCATARGAWKVAMRRYEGASA